MNFTNTLKKFPKNANIYLVSAFFFYMSMGAFSMLQGIYIKELNMGESFLGLILSLKTLAIAFAAIPCAMVVNKIGRKNGILLSMFLVPVLSILQGVFSHKIPILIFALLQGASQGFLMVSEAPFFMENSSSKTRITLFSYAFADNVFSSMLGYFIFGHISNLLSNQVGLILALKFSIIFSGILGLISCLFIVFIKESGTGTVATHNNKEFFTNALTLIKKPYPVKFLIYNLMIGFGAGLVVPYFNVYLKYKVNATTSQIGLIMALAQGAMGLGGLLTPRMAKKFGKVKTILICQVLSIPFLMLIALPPNIIIVGSALFIRNGLMNMAGPVNNSMSMELIEDSQRSIYSSINSISNNFTRAISSMLGGYIMHNFANGYEIPYFLTAIIYAIATLFFYKSFSTLEKDASKNKVDKPVSTLA